MKARLEEYRQLLAAFLSAGYQSLPFVERPPASRALLLRHDIDFDVDLAEELSTVEDQLSIRSTYFFMLRSASYNLLSPRNIAIVKGLRDRGHGVSLHFDPTLYTDVERGLEEELATFGSVLDVRPDCISIHRPLERFLSAKPFGGVRHTYQAAYQSDIRYFSDSQGHFRYGDPVESEAFRCGTSIHLLIHPIWWVTDCQEPMEILNAFLAARVERFRAHMGANCLPYRVFLERGA